MSDRLRTLMTAPLFKEPGSEAERADERSYPKGILLAPMGLADPDLRHQAEQYFIAAEAMVGLVLDNKVADYTVPTPILFLYRHSFELYLKVLIQKQGRQPKRKHSLRELVEVSDGLPDWATQRLYELDDIDLRSVMLRYGGVPGHLIEQWAELTFFRDAMRLLRDLFIVMVDGRQPHQWWLEHEDA